MKIIFTFLAILLAASVYAVTVDGFCYLEGQSDHSGTKVKFIKVSPSAVTDSTYTQVNGYFTKNVAVGVYNVEYSHSGTEVWTDDNRTLISNQTLTSRWLLPPPSDVHLGISFRYNRPRRFSRVQCYDQRERYASHIGGNNHTMLFKF